MRIRIFPIAAAVALAAFSEKTISASGWTPTISPTNSISAANSLIEDFNLPDHFAQLVADRAITDGFQAQHHQVEASALPTPVTAFAVRGREGRFVRVVRSQPGEEALKYRAALPAKFVPLRGFRAPILERAGERPPAALHANELSESQRRAAEWTTRRLAHDGLLHTLAQVVEILGPAQFLTNGAAGLDALAALGFPADLLACFPTGENAGVTNVAATVLAHVARRLSEGARRESLRTELRALPFCWPRARPEFQVAIEAGEHELGLLRMQAGGGYRDGNQLLKPASPFSWKGSKRRATRWCTRRCCSKGATCWPCVT